ncbi:hypothetical protein KY284_010581 [Solanum tuberosum]|nr:hypothetical protein KY284_010581 [Solanum tuberosum]
MAVVSSCREMFGQVLKRAKPSFCDDDVELTADKDSAFRRATRWCGGDDVKSAWPLWAGPHTCYNGNYNGKQGCKAERIRKDCLSSDCSLQLGNMKLESLVIADQHAVVNMYPGPVHIARHTLGIGFTRSIGAMITHDFCGTLVPQRPLVVLLAHTTVGSSTGVKSGLACFHWWRAGKGSKGHVAGGESKIQLFYFRSCSSIGNQDKPGTTCTVSLQRYYAGCYSKNDTMSVPVSLTRGGIPKIIPAIAVAPKMKKDTFQSITTPHSDIDSVREGMNWKPTWKSTPLLDNFVRRFQYSVDDVVDGAAAKYVKEHNIFVNLKHEIAAFIFNVNKIQSIQDGFFSPGILWSQRVLYPFDSNNTRFANESLDLFEKQVGPPFSSLLGAYQGVPLVTGRLSQAIEGGGKRRIFAICNYIKQRLLHPVHIWAMTVLSSLKTDGTFNQERPLQYLRLKRPKSCYSFDLKYTLIEMIWGSTLASSIVNSSLGLNTFLVSPPMVKKISEAYPLRSTPFVDCALLGDDILITDKKVANQYCRLLDRLSVTISFAKSIVSENGTIEFAKRFWIRDMQKDISPISLKALTSCRTTVGLCQLSCRYSIEISTLQRLAGAGYKAAPSPLNPYLKEKIIDYLREAVKPKQIQIFTKDLVFDGEREILEWAVSLNWMKQWLTWLSWYHTVALSPDVTIDQLFDVFGGLHGKDLLISPKDLPSLRKMDINDKNLGASEHINPFSKIPQGRVTKRAIVVAVWLTASTNTQPADSVISLARHDSIMTLGGIGLGRKNERYRQAQSSRQKGFRRVV